MAFGAGREIRCCPACRAVYRAEYPRCVNDGVELVMQASDPLVGTSIGPYVVDALLGEGGMGRVYRVHHARLIQKRYALKVLLGDLSATPPMRMRFAREAQSASRLSHPNVVAVCDFGVTDAGLAYLAMDLVEGTPLNVLIDGTAMDPDRVIRLARQLCAGLAHAHDLGLVHRDFKPDNIIVVDQPSGEVPRIADFGLVITSEADTLEPREARLTTTGIVMGTPAYVAPEQCTTNGVTDHRADLYALGVTMFEMLTGGFLPFDGEPAEIVGHKTTTDPPAIAERAPHVSPALAAVVDRLIARKPANRYPDARAVLAALDDAVRYPDDAALAAGASEPPYDDTTVEPARRRAARAADVEAVERTHSTPVPMSVDARARTDQLRRPRRGLTGIVIVIGAAVVTALVVLVAVWGGGGSSSGRVKPQQVAAANPSPAPPDPTRARTEELQPAITDDPDASETERTASTDEPRAAKIARAASTDGPRAADPDPPARPADRRRASHRAAKAKPARVAAAPAKPARVEPARVEPAPPPAVAAPPVADPPAPPPPPRPAPVAVEPRLAGLDVQGALPNATVRHALDRVLPATRACKSDRAGTVEVRFAIGEAKRATGVRASAHPTASCLTAALASLRTDTAPDVGDVDVRVRFAYEPRE